MSHFNQMASTLTAARWAPWSTQAAPPAGTSRTERIRCLLKQASRPITAAEICFDMADHFENFETSLVWLLLKYDIKKGGVIFEGGKYSWNKAYDEAEAASIRSAVKLLERHGYAVAKP